MAATSLPTTTTPPAPISRSSCAQSRHNPSSLAHRPQPVEHFLLGFAANFSLAAASAFSRNCVELSPPVESCLFCCRVVFWPVPLSLVPLLIGFSVVGSLYVGSSSTTLHDAPRCSAEARVVHSKRQEWTDREACMYIAGCSPRPDSLS